MKVTLILVGTELLSGMTLDTNSIYMAGELNKLGIEIINKLIVRDNIEEIKKAISYGDKEGDLILISGGMGPTDDDLTKLAVAQYLGKPLVIDPKDEEDIRGKYKERNLEFRKNSIREAEKIQGASVIENSVGMCKGIKIKNIALFPGVPRELKDLFPKYLEEIKKEYNLKTNILIEDLLIYGIPEAELEERIKHLFILDGIHYEFLAKDYGILVRLQSTSEKREGIENIKKEIFHLVGDNLIGEGDTRIEKEVVKKLIEKNLDISIGESCTGGMVSSKLIEVPGVSQVFIEGIVTYSNESKVKRLGVSKESLERYGAVSKEVCSEMLAGLSGKVKIATTGIAGPGGGTKEKPVGTVYIGIEINGKQDIKLYNFTGNRDKIRYRTMIYSLFETLKKIRRVK